MVAVGNALIVIDDFVALHPVAVSVNVNVTEPAETAAIKPVLSIVATAGLLLTQVPPVLGEAFMLAPTHKEVWGTVTTGNALMVTFAVDVFEQVPFVKLYVTT